MVLIVKMRTNKNQRSQVATKKVLIRLGGEKRKKKHTFTTGYSALEEVVQRGCGFSAVGVSQNLPGQAS